MTATRVSHREHAVLFDCAGEQSVGIVTTPAQGEAHTGLLIVVGGPQYRVGSHRFFVHLARQAATHGLAAMRFDYRGMGDSWAETRDFEQVEEDLRRALDVLMQQVPSLQRVVLWGLCDGASAACFQAAHDSRVSGLVLVNPWAHTPEGAATTRLRHYYLQRLLSKAFWQKLLSGRVDLKSSGQALLNTVRQSLARRVQLVRRRAAHPDQPTPRRPAGIPLPERMAQALSRSGVPVAIALSDDDKVAREFEDEAMPTSAWRHALDQQLVELIHLDGADHTVTSPAARAQLTTLSVQWARHMGARR